MQTQKNEKKFPVFDLVLILLVALAIAGGVLWVTSRKNVNNAEITYTVRFSNVNNEYSGKFEEGKQLYTSSGTCIGTIQAVSVTRSTARSFDRTPSPDLNGSYSYSETPLEEFSDVVATVRATADELPGGYFFSSERIAAGMTFRITIGDFAADGEILTLQKEASS